MNIKSNIACLDNALVTRMLSLGLTTNGPLPHLHYINQQFYLSHNGLPEDFKML